MTCRGEVFPTRHPEAATQAWPKDPDRDSRHKALAGRLRLLATSAIPGALPQNDVADEREGGT